GYVDHQGLHSLPTRRSSDLLVVQTWPLTSSTPTPYTAYTRPSSWPGTFAGVVRATTSSVRGSTFISVDRVTGGRPTAAATNTASDRKSTRLNSSHVKISYAV